MRDEIKVTQFGHLVAAPELRYTPDGKPVANFRVLTNHRWVDKPSGEEKEDVTGVRYECWGASGEALAKILKKGSFVYIESTIRNDSYDDPKNPGTKIFRDRFIVREWKILDRKEPGQSDAASAGTGDEPGAQVPQD